MITCPDYRDKKWHGDESNIIFETNEPFDISYKHVKARRLRLDYIFEWIDPDDFRKFGKKILREIKRR